MNPVVPRDRLLSTAGGLLIAAGAVTAFTGGAIGLGTTRPLLVIFSVVLLMGYGVVGYLLMTQGGRTIRPLVPVTAALVVATIWLLQTSGVDAYVDPGTERFILEPLLTVLLSFAGGAMVFALIEDATPVLTWPGKGAPMLSAVLHAAACAPIWCAYTLIAMAPSSAPGTRATIVSLSVIVATACVVGGYAASRWRHPMLTVIGASLGFIASASFLYQFMLGGGNRDAAWFGEMLALLGLIATGLPAAIASVAWTQIGSASDFSTRAKLEGDEANMSGRAP